MPYHLAVAMLSVLTAAALAAPEEQTEPARSDAQASLDDGAASTESSPPIDPAAWPDRPTTWPDTVGAGEPHIDASDELDLRVDGLFELSRSENSSTLWSVIFSAILLVALTIAGFSLFERGCANDRQTGDTWIKYLLICALGTCAFWAYGFAIGFGNWFNGPVAPGWYSELGPGLSLLNEGFGFKPDPANPGVFQYALFGTKGFFLRGVDDTSVFRLFALMLPFLITAISVPGGAMAGRWSLKGVCLYSFWAVAFYSLYADWVWGGGWLAQAGLNWGLGHGAVDFAGSGVVHALGGMMALAGCMVIGPRQSIDVPSAGSPRRWLKAAAMIAGTLVLSFLWCGTPRAAVIAAIAAFGTSLLFGRKKTVKVCCQGFLAGIVACCAVGPFVDGSGAAGIGAGAGILSVLATRFFDRRGIDDVTGAISVNGICGLWGLISVGLFANGEYGSGWSGVIRNRWTQQSGLDGVRGLSYGDASQLGAQFLAAAAVVILGFALPYALFRLGNSLLPMGRAVESARAAGSD